MITETEIKKAARLHYIGSTAQDPESDFYAGAKWAIKQTSAENARLRAALESIARTAEHDNGSLSDVIHEKAKTALEK